MSRSASSDSRAPELIVELTDKAADIMVQLGGLDPALAKFVAHQLAAEMRQSWGGSLLYFPKGEGIELDARDLKLYNDWDGSPSHLGDLARKYGISIQWAYKITKEVRRREVNKRQVGLFD